MPLKLRAQLERLRQFPRTVGQVGPPTPLHHELAPRQRFNSANQDTFRHTLIRGDGVQTPVNPVVAVHVDGSGSAVQGIVAPGPADSFGGV